MFAKIARVFLAIAFLAIVVLIPSGSVSATSNGCQVNIAATTGAVPFSATIEVVGPEGPTLVSFGDTSPDAIGRNHVHVYNAVSSFIVTALINGNDGYFYRCHGYVKTIPAVATATPAPVTPIPTPVVTPQSGSTSNFGTTSADGTIQGNNNIAPVVNGDGNRFVIKIEQPVTQPVTITSKPIVTQKTNIITAFIHAILKAMEQFIHTLDESWFKPTLVK